MAVQNHIEKAFEEVYQSGQPATPGRTVYVDLATVWAAIRASGTDDIEDEGDWVKANYGPTATFKVVSGGKLEIYIPGTAAVQEGYRRKAIVGWNGGGRSIDAMQGNGYFEFTMTPRPRRVLVGLVGQGVAKDSTAFDDPTHAFYVRTDNPNSRIRIRESGAKPNPLPAAWPTTKAKTQPRFRIMRFGQKVKYLLVDPDTGKSLWTHVSSKPSDGPVFLDVHFYRSGSYVENPVLVTPESDPHAWNDGLVLTSDGYVEGEITIGAVLSDTEIRLIVGEIELSGSMGGIENYLLGQIDLVGAMAEEAFSIILGEITLYGGTVLDYEEPDTDTSEFYGMLHLACSAGFKYFTPMIVNAGISLDGLFYNDPFSRILGDIELAGAAGTYLWPDGVYQLDDSVTLATTFAGDMTWNVAFVSALTGEVELDAEVLWDGSLESLLNLDDDYSFAAVLAAMFSAGLTFDGIVSTGLLPDVQYAVNLATGALTTYRNFGFNSFAEVDGVTYGARADGIYRLRDGDDDGSMRDFFIDFGDTDFGAKERKNVDSIYFGLATDGEMVLAKVIVDDGTEYIYSVTQHAPTSRALVGRGLVSRRWGLRLEITDATELELDNIEFSVAVHGRRRMT